MRYIKLFLFDIRKYWNYTKYSIKSTLKAELSNTVLGYVWWVLDPLLHMIVYTFLVQVLFKRATPNFPVYVFTALLPWKVATTTMLQSTNCIRANAGILKQVYLPKFILPMTILSTNLIKLFFGVIVLFGMMLLYKIPFTWHIIEVIPVLIVFLFFYYSVSVFLTHMGVLFDDVRHLLNYLIMFWFFASPGMWSLDLLPESLHKIVLINPNVTFFISFRDVFMYGNSPNYIYLGIWFLLSLILLYFGINNLYKSDKNYTKVI